MATIKLTSGSGLVDLSGGDYVIGTPDSDFVIGSPGNDTMDAAGGDDLINGNGGDDLLLGGEGNDNLNGNTGNETLYGNNGQDNIYGETGDDKIYGGKDNDNLWGDEGNDYILGEEGNDQLRGNQGIDTLQGNNGNDELFGGQDNDLLYGNSGDDKLNDNEGDDTLSCGQGNDSADGGEGSDYITGDFGNDSLAGGIGSDTLDGGDGNDYLMGDPREGPPAFDPGTGQPVPPLEQRLRNDVAQDVILGGTGNDTAAGSTGNDQIFGNEGADLLFGNTGTDIISGGQGNDSLYGGADTDQLSGNAGDDALVCNTGNDLASGGEGNDMVYGNTGADDLKGDAGNDTIYGGQDNDTIEGGAGTDQLTGNSGADVFSVFANTASPQVAQVDVVLDFETDKDFVYLQTGLAYETINIVQGSGDNASDTIIQDTITGQFLLLLKNVSRTAITRNNFLPALATTPTTVTPPVQPSVLSFGSATYTVSEPTTGTSQLPVTVTRTGNTDGTVSVTVTATAGTATSPLDYTETSQVVTFADGESGVKTVNFTINNDGNNTASTKNFTLQLSGASAGATLGTTTSATATITGVNPGTIEFGAPQFTVKEDGTVVQQVVVKRTNGSQGQISANIAISATTDPNAAASINTAATIPVTFASGDQADKIVDISPALVINQVATGEVSANLNITVTSGGAIAGTPAILKIQDLDTPTIKVEATDPRADENPLLTTPADQLGQFTFTRTGRDISQALTVSYAIDTTPPTNTTENAPAVALTDYQTLTGTVTFAAGAATATVDVTPIRNPASTGNRDVKVQVNAGTGYIVDTTTNKATVEIVDADSQIIEITASIPAGKETVAGDAPQPAQFKISRKDLTGAAFTTGDVTVNYSVSGSATRGADYEALTSSIVIPNGQSEVLLPVNVLDDLTAEPTKTVQVSLTPATGTTLYAIDTLKKKASVSILDNEKPTLLLYPSKSPAFQTSPLDPTTPPVAGEFLLQRFGDLTPSLTVPYTIGGDTTARPGIDFSLTDFVAGSSGGATTIASGIGEVRLVLTPIIDATRPARPDVDTVIVGLNDPGDTGPYILGTPSVNQQMVIINNALI